VRDRLLNLAKARGENFDFILNRYASERLLFRLSRSTQATRFILKGATLFAVWSRTPHRPTRDLDFLGIGDASLPSLEAAFRDIVLTTVNDDGLTFDPAAVSGQSIKEGDEYEGVRIRLTALLMGARIPLQIDIGFGDAVTPPATLIEFPTLLGQAPPLLRAYPRETVIAEKLHAMVNLGHSNSRMKDFYDLWVLSRDDAWDQQLLRQAIRATFTRRQTRLPVQIPLALTDEFGNDDGKRAQWLAFCRKSGLTAAPTFSHLIQDLRDFLWPLMSSLPTETADLLDI
jgi:predicted nucleotidyltransferase component of viral defense system